MSMTVSENDVEMPLPATVPGQIALVPTGDPAAMLRICADGESCGEILLEHLAYNPTLGWYRQRLMRVPQAAAHELGAALRLADCIMGRGAGRAPSLRLVASGEDAA